MTQHFTASPANTPVQRQREFFQTGQTRSIAFRPEQLSKLKQIIIDHQGAVLQAAKRIAWGNNARQTCIAPDYLLVYRQIKDALIDLIKICYYLVHQSFYANMALDSQPNDRQRNFRLLSIRYRCKASIPQQT
jgi:acyl-CoA reductase-like NAD-dependent aldehyde dehydrogenase